MVISALVKKSQIVFLTSFCELKLSWLLIHQCECLFAAYLPVPGYPASASFSAVWSTDVLLSGSSKRVGAWNMSIITSGYKTRINVFQCKLKVQQNLAPKNRTAGCVCRTPEDTDTTWIKLDWQLKTSKMSKMSKDKKKEKSQTYL